ncbi:hypothetical protein AERO9A_250235 [Aeromonas salmonicida]|nr:hypothetical protein AERO9A_250235 [Aeromonas salmonicida]
MPFLPETTDAAFSPFSRHKEHN